MTRIIPFLIAIVWCTSVNGQVNLSSGLTAYFPFSGNFNDQSGNGNNGTAMNGTTFTADQWGNPNSAAQFDGIDDWVNINAAASLKIDTAQTIAFRFKTDATYGQFIMSKSNYIGTPYPMNFAYLVEFNFPNLGGSGLVYGTTHSNTCTSSPSPHYSFQNNAVVSNQWYCVCLVFQNGLKKMYVNGTLVSTQNATGVNPTKIDSCSGGTLRLGVWWASDPKYFKGTMDEVRLYNRALNIQEIDSLCNYIPATPQDTVINKYAAVLSRNSCDNSFLVDTATDFNVGDTILVIQMKGAVIDSSNSATFGSVLDYKSAGNYEYNVVLAKTGNNLTLKYKLTRTYEIPAGRVQFVKVPHAINYTVNTQHSCMPWTGTKGGVFALNVDNTLTLNNNIDVSGKGFKGGQINNGTTFLCDRTDFFYPLLSNDGGEKGEGITEISTEKRRGKGKLANGGGGGNNTNAGGGGGSNGATGGDGGHEWVNCNTSLSSGGFGGVSLPYNIATNKIFLGGGGGAGHENNNDTDPAGNGGGLVIIKTNTIVGNNKTIAAKGGNCIDNFSLPPISGGDGQSGGGAGGTILLTATTVFSSPFIQANGGSGGNVYANVVHGPGGGGSGGAVLLANSLIPTTNISTTGGQNGLVVPLNNAHFTTSGSGGITQTNFTGIGFPTTLFQINVINANFVDSVTDCFTRKFKSTTTTLATGVASVLWDFGGGITSPLTSPSYTFSGFGTFPVKLIITDSNGCKDSITKSVIIKYRHFANAGKDTSVCKGAIVTLNATGGTIYSWSPAAQVTSPNAATTVATPAGYPATYIVTVTDSINCVDLDTVIVKLKPGTPIKALPADTMVCKGSKVQLSASGGLKYSWSNGSLLTDSLIANPIATIPAQTTFVVTGTDEGGCANKDSVTVYLRSNPNIVITTPDAGISCNKKSVQLYATGALSYIWHPGIYCNDSLIPSPTVNPTKTTTFTVTGTDFHGCKDTSSIQIIAYYESSVYLPNAFTPDGDGLNDIIRPLSYCGFKLTEFRIYNRWGECVFLSNSLAYGWDGNYKGQRADMGVYSYLIKGNEENGTPVLKKGNITLLR